MEGIRAHKKAFQDGTPATLLAIILRHRPSMATDPRDKVYGFLGLCTDNIIQADYRLEPQKVYKLITKRYLLKDGNLRIVTAPSSPVSARSDSLPSWVPDWAATDVATPLALRTEPLPEVSYDATSGSRWTPGFSEDGNQLLVEAQFIDGVAELGPSRQPYRPTTPGAKSLFKQLRAELDVSANWQKVCLGNAGGWDNEYPSRARRCSTLAGRSSWRGPTPPTATSVASRPGRSGGYSASTS